MSQSKTIQFIGGPIKRSGKEDAFKAIVGTLKKRVNAKLRGNNKVGVYVLNNTDQYIHNPDLTPDMSDPMIEIDLDI